VIHIGPWSPEDGRLESPTVLHRVIRSVCGRSCSHPRLVEAHRNEGRDGVERGANPVVSQVDTSSGVGGLCVHRDV
jgi:hypothetical protein